MVSNDVLFSRKASRRSARLIILLMFYGEILDSQS